MKTCEQMFDSVKTVIKAMRNKSYSEGLSYVDLGKDKFNILFTSVSAELLLDDDSVFDEQEEFIIDNLLSAYNFQIVDSSDDDEMMNNVFYWTIAKINN